MSRRKTPSEVRAEASEVCEDWADEANRAGNHEAADMLRDAALQIRKIVLTGAAAPVRNRSATVRSWK